MTVPSAGVSIRRATPADTGPLVSVLVDAFFDGPVADWLVPDHDDRRAVYRRYFALVLRHGLAHGHVDTTTDRSAVAIWYARPEPPPSAPPEHQAALEAATGPYAPKFTLLEAMFDAFHPANRTTTSRTWRSAPTNRAPASEPPCSTATTAGSTRWACPPTSRPATCATAGCTCASATGLDRR